MNREEALQGLRKYFNCELVADDNKASLLLAKGDDVRVHLKLMARGGARVVIDVFAFKKNADEVWGRLGKSLSALRPSGCNVNEKKIDDIKTIQGCSSLIARYDTGKSWDQGLSKTQMDEIAKAVAEVCKASGCVRVAAR